MNIFLIALGLVFISAGLFLFVEEAKERSIENFKKDFTVEESSNYSIEVNGEIKKLKFKKVNEIIEGYFLKEQENKKD